MSIDAFMTPLYQFFGCDVCSEVMIILVMYMLNHIESKVVNSIVLTEKNHLYFFENVLVNFHPGAGILL